MNSSPRSSLHDTLVATVEELQRLLALLDAEYVDDDRDER